MWQAEEDWDKLLKDVEDSYYARGAGEEEEGEEGDFTAAGRLPGNLELVSMGSDRERARLDELAGRQGGNSIYSGHSSG